MPLIAVHPADPGAGPLQVCNDVSQRLGAVGPPAEMPKRRFVSARDLEAVMEIVPPGAQVDRPLVPSGLVEAGDIREEADGGVGDQV